MARRTGRLPSEWQTVVRPGWLVSLFGIDYFARVSRRFAWSRFTSSSDSRLVHISTPQADSRKLDLHRSPVTDARLGYLEGLTDLQSLTLFHTPVSDTGLVRLTKMHRLRTLSIEDTSVTDSGAAALQKALPKLSIKR